MSFKKALRNVMGNGKYDEETARKILAKRTREASPAAKRRNPNLRRVK